METPPWKQPTPHWLLPYGFCLAGCVGMTLSQYPSLFLNVVCVAHPPENTSGTLSTINATPFEGIDPETCRRDVGVQQWTAYIMLLSSVISGILQVASTGFWSSLSDRVGRIVVLGISNTAFLVDSLTFLIIASFPQIVQVTGLGVLLLGPVLLALFGGMPVLGALVQAYLADTSKDMLVARLSLLQGVLAGGVMLGPLVATWLVDASGDVLMPYKVAICVQAVLSVLLFSAAPESLSPEARKENIQKAAAAREAATKVIDDAEAAWEARLANRESRGVLHRAFSVVRRPLQRIARAVMALIEPLEMFIPRRDMSHPTRARNWNLFIIAIATFMTSMQAGVSDSKVQYSMYVFGWGQKEISRYFSMMGLCRALVLMAVVPLVTRFLEPRFRQEAVESADATERTPLLEDTREATTEATTEQTKRKGSSAYDLFIVFASLSCAVIAFLILGLNAAGNQAIYVAGSALFTLAQPAGSAISALSLELAESRQPGRLFGALGIIEALGSTFLAKVLFTTVYTLTLKTYPPTIFLVAAASFFLAVVSVAFVRLPGK